MIKDCTFCVLGTMYALEKDALIFDVDNDLITVVRPDVVPGGQADNLYPLLIVYKGYHYESVYPSSCWDRELTKAFVEENTEYKGEDFPAHFEKVMKKMNKERAKSNSNDGKANTSSSPPPPPPPCRSSIPPASP